MKNFEFDALGQADLPAAARLHKTAFPSFFLSSLGEGFLREFYRAFLTPAAITVVARDQSGQITGVVVGHPAPDGFFRSLVLRRWYAFLWQSTRLLLSQPSVAPRLVRALRYRGQASGQTGALLSSICVDPAQRGLGLGRQLIDQWTERLTARGGTRAYLTTDAVDNDDVNAFYESAGWTLDSSFHTPEGRHMNVYTWHPSPAVRAP